MNRTLNIILDTSNHFNRSIREVVSEIENNHQDKYKVIFTTNIKLDLIAAYIRDILKGDDIEIELNCKHILIDLLCHRSGGDKHNILVGHVYERVIDSIWDNIDEIIYSHLEENMENN